MDGRPPRAQATLRSLILPVYLPGLLVGIGEGAVIPFIVLAARDLGASVAVAGFVFALHSIATLVFDLPAGALVARLGDRRAMTVATVLLVVALAGCAWSPSLVPFGASVFALGAAWALWRLARFTYVTEVVPVGLRGRAISTLGGVQRVARFLGPLLAAGAIQLTNVQGAFYVHMVAAVAALAALLSVPDHPASGSAPDPARGGSFVRLAREHADVLLRAGIAVMIFGVLRASRDVAIPLWADHIGLDAASVGLIFSIASALEMTLFYPAGWVMDRWGRRFVSIPSLTLLSACFLVLPLTASFAALTAVALLGAFGNGLGSGIVMTMGSDAAPRAGRPEFLAIWRLISDAGQSGGPLLIAAVGGLASIATASWLVGAVGLAGAVFIRLRVRESLVRPGEPGDAAGEPPAG